MKKHEFLNPVLWIMAITVIVVALAIPDIYRQVKDIQPKEFAMALIAVIVFVCLVFLIRKWSDWYNKKYGQ